MAADYGQRVEFAVEHGTAVASPALVRRLVEAYRNVDGFRLQGRSTVRRHSSVLCVSRSAVQINRAPPRQSIAS